MQASYTDPAQARATVTLAAGEVALPGVQGPGVWTLGPDATAALLASGVTIAAYAPPAATPPTVTGNQWAFALSSLGLASAWRIGVTKSKDSDQVRVDLIARDTPLVASDPLLIRVAANAGTDSSNNPVVVVATVFATAQGMPL